MRDLAIGLDLVRKNLQARDGIFRAGEWGIETADVTDSVLTDSIRRRFQFIRLFQSLSSRSSWSVAGSLLGQRI
jgi:hypothetical protein